MTDKSITENKLTKILKANNDDIIDRFINYADKNLASKNEVHEIKASIKLLPSKEEFFFRMDKISGEY